jgi:hypothetical protein
MRAGLLESPHPGFKESLKQGCEGTIMSKIILSNGVVLFSVHGVVYSSLHDAVEAMSE